MTRVVILSLALWCSACTALRPPTPTTTPIPTIDPRPTLEAERVAVVEWATRMGELLTVLQTQLDQSNAMFDAFATARPSEEETRQLDEISAAASDLYLDALALDAPDPAAPTHELFVDQFDRSADVLRLYSLSLSENDLSYYNQSVEAQQEAARISAKAYDSFIALLDRYAISCDEIAYC